MEKQAQVNLTRLPSLIKLSGVIKETEKKKRENNVMFYFSLWL